MGSMGSDSIENNEKCTVLNLARPYPDLTSRWNGRPTADVFSPSPVASCVGRRSLRSFDDPQSFKLNPPHRVFDNPESSKTLSRHVRLHPVKLEIGVGNRGQTRINQLSESAQPRPGLTSAYSGRVTAYAFFLFVCLTPVTRR